MTLARAIAEQVTHIRTTVRAATVTERRSVAALAGLRAAHLKMGAAYTRWGPHRRHSKLFFYVRFQKAGRPESTQIHRRGVLCVARRVKHPGQCRCVVTKAYSGGLVGIDTYPPTDAIPAPASPSVPASITRLPWTPVGTGRRAAT